MATCVSTAWRKNALGTAVLIFFGSFGSQAAAQNPFPIVVVDKGKNTIHMAEHFGDRIELKKSFHVTLGKAVGDKEVEKDLKTPEGVYFFTGKIMPPALKKKFGKMALMMNYPNPVDQLSGKTGYDIMLHATDDPSRLTRDRDSEGCVVVNDDQITEIASSVRLGLTPIVIYPELKPEYLLSTSKPELQQAFRKWLEAWNGKDIESYIGSYSDRFVYNGMNIKKYREYKTSLNKKYATIDVRADNLRFFYHPKYDVVSFTQRYSSTFKNGVKAFQSSGTKVLYFVKDGERYKIADESYSNLIEN